MSLPFSREIRDPSSEVLRFVSEYWMIRWPPGSTARRVVHLPPDGSVHVAYRALACDGTSRRAARSTLRVRGPMPRARREPASHAPVVLGFRLWPGMSQALLPVPAGDLAGRWVDLDTLRPGFAGPLRAGLDRDLDPGSLFETLDAALAAELPGRADRVESRMPGWVRAIRETGSCRPAGISRRHLSRLFGIHVGLGPRKLARIFRFHEALRRGAPPAGEPWSRWVDLRRYADQAHFVREFREMITLPPGAYFDRGPGACPFTSEATGLARKAP